VLENQFRRYFEMADRTRGITGETLLQLLERRFDNVIYRLGLATSRAQARQLVRHGHFTVNGRKVDIPSYSVKPGDTSASRRAARRTRDPARARGGQGTRRSRVALVRRRRDGGRIASLPTREQINLPVQEQLIVELYSK
jgi:small subunit ribosomal protein S4